MVGQVPNKGCLVAGDESRRIHPNNLGRHIFPNGGGDSAGFKVYVAIPARMRAEFQLSAFIFCLFL